jgi:large subunit ribosomal protein L24
MKQDWSPHWKSSSKPGKQVKYKENAPLHIRHKLMASHLNKDLKKQYGRRSFPIRKGDKVKVMRGEYHGTIGEITKVDAKHYKVFVKGAEEKTKAGPTRFYPIAPSNLLLISLNLEDKKRAEALGRDVKKTTSK